MKDIYNKNEINANDTHAGHSGVIAASLNVFTPNATGAIGYGYDCLREYSYKRRTMTQTDAINALIDMCWDKSLIMMSVSVYNDINYVKPDETLIDYTRKRVKI